MRVASCGTLPENRNRVRASDFAQMARITARTQAQGGQVNTEVSHHALARAHDFYVEGFVFTTPKTETYQQIMLMGGSNEEETQLADLPHDLVYRHVYVTMPSDAVNKDGNRFGIRASVRFWSFLDGHVGDIFAKIADGTPGNYESNAIWARNTDGRWRVDNCYLQADTENFFLGGGGGPSNIVGALVSSVTLTNSYLPKNPAFTGRFVKNGLEFKEGQNIIVDQVVIGELYNGGSEQGMASGVSAQVDKPYSVTSELQFSRLRIKGAASGFNILGVSLAAEQRPSKNILLEDVIFEQINPALFPGNQGGHIIRVSRGMRRLRVNRITAVSSNDMSGVSKFFHFLESPPAQITGFRFTNSVVERNNGWGFWAEQFATTQDTAALQAVAPDAVVRGNVMARWGDYFNRAENSYPATAEEIGYVDLANKDFTLSPASTYRTAGIGGTLPGADPSIRPRLLAVEGGQLAAGGAPADTTPPVVSFPQPSAVTAAGTISLSATASDNVSVARVELRLGDANGTIVATDTSAPYSFDLNLNHTDNGTRTYTARAFDADGNSASQTRSLTINIPAPDTIAPSLTLSATPATVTSVADVTLNVSASDNVGVTSVEFRRGTATGVLLTTKTLAPYVHTLALGSADNGTQTFTAIARDAAGNATSTSVNVIVNVGGSPPVATGDLTAVLSALAALQTDVNLLRAQTTANATKLGTLNTDTLPILSAVLTGNISVRNRGAAKEYTITSADGKIRIVSLVDAAQNRTILSRTIQP